MLQILSQLYRILSCLYYLIYVPYIFQLVHNPPTLIPEKRSCVNLIPVDSREKKRPSNYFFLEFLIVSLESGSVFINTENVVEQPPFFFLGFFIVSLESGSVFVNPENVVEQQFFFLLLILNCKLEKRLRILSHRKRSRAFISDLLEFIVER